MTDFTAQIEMRNDIQFMTVTQDLKSVDRCAAPMQAQTTVYVSVEGYTWGKPLLLANPLLVREFARP